MLLEIALYLIIALFLSFIFISARHFLVNKRLSGLFFTFLIITSIVWVISLYSFTSTSNISTAYISSRFIWVAAPLLIGNLYCFTYAFRHEDIRKHQQIKLWLIGVNLVCGLILSLISIGTNLVVENIDVTIRKIFYGPGYILVILYIIINTLLILKNISGHRKEASSKSKNSINIIYLGIILTIFSALFTNVVIPLVVGNSKYSYLGIYTSIPINVAITYGILGYRLFEARIVIGRLAYFSLLTAIIIVAFYFSYYIDILLWGNATSINALLTGIPVAFGFLTFYDWFKKNLQKNVTTRIINPGYDPTEEIAEYNITISTKLDSDEIASRLEYILNKTIRPNFTVIYYKSNYNEKLQEILNTKAIDLKNIPIEEIIDFWRKTFFKIIDLDQLNIEIPNYFKTESEFIIGLMSIMELHSIKLIIPILDPHELIGVLVIGERSSRYPYNSTQLDFISSITQITGVAFARSKLYEQVQEFNQKLKTEVELATKQLQEKNTQLQEQLRREKDMMDILGHELRTPLSIARNAILMMQASMAKIHETETQTQLTHLLEKATENIRREVKILETVLSSTRIENNRLQIIFEKVDIKDAINDAIDGNDSEAEKKGLKLYAEVPAEELFVTGGRDQVQEIIDNLVSNAIKYTQKGEIKITLTKDDNFGIIAISDTGEGIPAEAIPNLGKKFFRVNPYLQDNDEKLNIIRPGGTGIGLYVVFNLIRMMKGTIDIKSEVGQGSTFTVKLPLHKVIETAIAPQNT